ncbi:MAG: 3-ketosteroid 9alpha-monooxygenase subunit A, partial [Parvicella sp.]
APNHSPSDEDVANAKMAQDGALAAFSQDLQIWANKRPAIQIMALPVERNFRLGRIWYKQFYNPLADAATYHDQVVGKHHLKGLDKPGELAMSLEE